MSDDKNDPQKILQNIVQFPDRTLDEEVEQTGPDRVQALLEEMPWSELEGCVLVGFRPDGSFLVGSTQELTRDTHWLLALAERSVMDLAINGE